MVPSTPRPDPAASGALARGLLVLTTIARRGPLNAAQVSTALDVPLSSVYRILASLRAFGLVIERSGAYELDARFAARAADERTVARIAERSRLVLRTLVAATGATADVLVRSGRHAICVGEVTPADLEPTILPQGDPLPLHAGAEQRVLLAFAPAEILDEVLISGPPRVTAATLTPERLLTSLAEIRLRHLAVSHGEFQTDAVAVGAPVLVGGSVVCSVGVAGPRERCDTSWVRTAAPHVRRAAADLAESLTS